MNSSDTTLQTNVTSKKKKKLSFYDGRNSIVETQTHKQTNKKKIKENKEAISI